MTVDGSGRISVAGGGGTHRSALLTARLTSRGRLDRSYGSARNGRSITPGIGGNAITTCGATSTPAGQADCRRAIQAGPAAAQRTAELAVRAQRGIHDRHAKAGVHQRPHTFGVPARGGRIRGRQKSRRALSAATRARALAQTQPSPSLPRLLRRPCWAPNGRSSDGPSALLPPGARQPRAQR